MNADLSAARRSRAIYRAMSSDFLLREQFVTDPIGIYSEYVRGTTPDPESASVANHLIYAIASNQKLSGWLARSAAAAGAGAGLTRASLAAELAQQVSGSGDPATVAALLRAGSSPQVSLAPALDLLRSIIGANPRTTQRGTEFTPGPGGTEFSPGGRLAPGTEFSPGTEFTPGTGTEMSPGTGTEISPGTGTESSPGAGTEMSPGTGTESSPGTGTEMTPGTGTEFSPGGIFGRLGDLAVVLEALREFASQLRGAGALRETGFE